MYLVLYTDGACKQNPGVGGFGAHFEWNDVVHEVYGGERETTNNKMELSAVIEGVKYLREKLNYTGPLEVRSDSQYVLKGLNEWMPNWKKNNWRTASKQPVKNKELWEALDAEMKHFKEFKLTWVKGHSDEPGNEKADTLANFGVAKTKDYADYFVLTKEVPKVKPSFKM